MSDEANKNAVYKTSWNVQVNWKQTKLGLLKCTN